MSTEASTTPAIRIERRRAAGYVLLDRPRQHNALDTAMRAAMAEAFPRFARDPEVYAVVISSASSKAFSAGGDVREIIGWYGEDPVRARAAFADEYRLNWLLECFSKPTVSLIDGMVMGSGVGITQFGTHRVAGAGYRFAMPETMIGLFPDVGAAHVLAKLPDEIGTYLGLTGRTIGRADGFRLKLATHCIDAARFAEIVDRLEGAYPVDPLLDERHADPGEGELEPYRETIATCFSAASVPEIMARLAAVRGGAAAFAQGVAADLAKRSPTSLAITLRHLRAARDRDLRTTLEMDYRLACRCLEGHDFAAGVRAVLVEKTAPQWRPARIEDVTEAMVAAHFAPLADELRLPTRSEMQVARV